MADKITPDTGGIDRKPKIFCAEREGADCILYCGYCCMDRLTAMPSERQLLISCVVLVVG